MATDREKIREAEEVGPFYAVVNYGNIGSPLWAHGPYETKEEAKEKAKSIRHYFSPTDRSYYHAWCRVYPQAIVDKGLERGTIKINNPKKYTESTPLADRDAYQSWKDERDDVESMSSKEKFSTELYNRNQKIYKVWYDMIEKVMNAGGFASDGDGFDAFLDEKDPFLVQTGYYDSFSFCHSGLDVHEYNSGGIGIGVYYKDGTEAGGDVYKEFIPKLKKTGGVELSISCLVCYDSDDMENLKSEKQMMNLFTKYLIGEGRSRSQIASVIKFFNEIINGNGQVYFPGADSVGFYGLEDGRPSIMVTYSVSVTPTEEEVKNVVNCVRTMDREVIGPLYW